MTTIVKDVAAKFAIATVAVAMIFSMSAMPALAQEQSIEDLQALINSLMEQIAELEGQMGGGDDSMSSSSVCPYTWTRDLSQGSTGADVMKLQQFLNENPDLRVAATGAGSPGMETEYYGPATAAAVSKMQVMFRAEILTPNGLVNPTGYFGASSRAKANDLCVTPAVDAGDEDGMDDEDGMEDEDDEDEDDDMTLSGEGTLATFEVDDEEDEVMEGEEDVVVASLTLEAENGDLELSRVTMTLQEGSDAPANGEDEPWEVFEEVSLWVDGDKVASFEADDEDNYLDEDIGEFRFTDLALFLEEDEEVEVLVAVSVMNSVDDADVTDGADWAIDPTEIRYFDADGVATTDDDVDELDDAGIEFDIQEEGFEDGAEIESSSDDPDATTLKVDDGSDESDEFLTHVFEIEVDEDSSDLVVEDVWYAVTMTNTAGTAIAGGQEDVLSEITMTIDGVTVEGEAVASGTLPGGTDAEEDPIASGGGTTTVHYLFEFDEDVELEGDETYDVEVMMVFEGQDGNYANGVTIQGTADADSGTPAGELWEVEGLDSDNELSGTDSSEVHTLANAVPVISGVDSSVDRNEAGDAGTISFEFNVEADDEDIVLNFADVDGDISTTSDVLLSVTPGGGVFTASIVEIEGDSTTDTGADTITIQDDDNATFAVDVSFASSSATGAYRVTLESIGGVEVDEISDPLNI